MALAIWRLQSRPLRGTVNSMNIHPRDRFQGARRSFECGEVTAVLGPTNTGKTHLAVERMLGHASGMIGLPLRLLAREIYDRVVRMRGAACVALITGEEKILPARPSYYVCTVESMPVSIETEFLAVDEIQLCADAERGHIFTDRLLNARGRRETMFLGAETMRPLVRHLLPEARFVTRPRFSQLTYTGSNKLSRMPRRSAIVAFSADAVYGIAELIRRQRGGAAVVMGSLSPRTRNAQVALFQSGEVDFLVATDAIGMGINMDVDHIAFASLSKFDGFGHRDLRPTEVGQIAGRAGRYLNDGTFGTTGDAGQMDEDLIAQVENHRFDTLRTIKWRNSALDFGSIARLIASLEELPGLRGLGRTRENCDLTALRLLAADTEVARMAGAPAAVKRLWQVCQVPDFRKLGPELHARLLAELYRYQMSDAGVLPEDYVARHVDRFDRVDGDIDALSTRIAHIRTWTFVANRSGWLADSSYWRERTRAIEDRLSDALHEKLTLRFIDRRTSVLMKRLHQKEELMASLTPEGDVMVEGEFVGRLDGFRFSADPSVDGIHAHTLRNAASQALQGEIGARAFRLDRHARIDDGKIIAVGDDGLIRWEGMVVARLSPGADLLSPRVELIADSDLLSGHAEIAVREALEAWLTRRIRAVLEPLFALQESTELAGTGKGLAFQLVETLGLLPRTSVSGFVKNVDQTERAKLRKLGVRFGEHYIYMPALIKPGPAAMKLRLWRISKRIEFPLSIPAAGLSSVPTDPAMPEGFYLIAGYGECGPRAIRIDMLERLLVQLRQKNMAGPFPLTAQLWSPVGCGVADFEAIMRALGYAPVSSGAAPAGDAPVTDAVEVDETPSEMTAEGEAEEQLVMDLAEELEEPTASRPDEPQGANLEPTFPPDPEIPQAVEASDTDAPDATSPPQVLWKFQPPRRSHSPKNTKPRREHVIPQRNAPKRAVSETRLLDPAIVQAREAEKAQKNTNQHRNNSKGKTKPAKPQGNIKLSSKPTEQKPRQQAAEKPIDPDSPFAALQALKERMQKSA
ncbi:MAG: helicase-related protein [Alphaproteobacteria bacterium]|nr:helicase-related protein [Alphaproteobacteria bacterium]